MGIALTVIGVTGFILGLVFLWMLALGFVTKSLKKTIRIYRSGFNELEQVIRQHQIAGDDLQVYLDIIDRCRMKVIEDEETKK